MTALAMDVDFLAEVDGTMERLQLLAGGAAAIRSHGIRQLEAAL